MSADQLRRVGQAAQLTPDVSPFQVGTRGRWQGRGFEIMGRIRRAWEDGQWNEWLLAFDNGDSGWLAEAQGELYLSFPFQDESALKIDMNRLQPGANVSVAGSSYLVTDRRKARIAGAEGYLPFSPTPEERLMIDLISKKGEFLSAEVIGNSTDWYKGQHIAFDELSFTQLRELDGWRF